MLKGHVGEIFYVVRTTYYLSGLGSYCWLCSLNIWKSLVLYMYDQA